MAISGSRFPPACVRTRTLSGRQGLASHQTKSGALTLTGHLLFLSGHMGVLGRSEERAQAQNGVFV